MPCSSEDGRSHLENMNIVLFKENNAFKVTLIAVQESFAMGSFDSSMGEGNIKLELLVLKYCFLSKLAYLVLQYSYYFSTVSNLVMK